MSAQADLTNQFRRLWGHHVIWTRLFIISTLEELDDLEYVTNRLLENPADFANILSIFYGNDNSFEFEELLREHLTIAADLVKALKQGETMKADQIRKDWINNADDIASFLASLNPYWDEEEWKSMLQSHLTLTENEIKLRLNENYSQDIANFNEIESQALDMADYMASGIIQQFQL